MKILKAAQFKSNDETYRPTTAVAKIIKDVKQQGLKAIASYAKKWDGGVPKNWLVPLTEAKKSWKNLDKNAAKALKSLESQLTKYSKATLPTTSKITVGDMKLTQEVKPLASVAVYVPGGNYPLLSSVMMGLIPARVAGVKRRVLLTPAKNGKVHSTILAAAHLGGATEIWPIGGAQAVAAAALGAGKLKPVDKIVGPGNSYVTEAKRQLYGLIDIDMLAGPSELCVIADATTDLTGIAYDLLAQAEHGTDSVSIVLSRSDKILKALQNLLEQKAKELYDDAQIKQILSQVIGLKCRSLCEVCDTADHIASEHLHIAVKKTDQYLKKINNYGSAFLGNTTPVALGDYISGGNHVLPTGRAARYRGGLSVDDFLIKRCLQEHKPTKNQNLFKQGALLAAAEGLRAHEMSLRYRF